jgi:glycosyltransferase 2 family protein
MWKNRFVVFAFKLFVSGVLLAVVLRGLDVSAVGKSLARLSPQTIIMAAVLFLLAHSLNAVKLLMLMKGRHLRELIRYTFVGLFYGTVLPGQVLGDAMKAYRLVRPSDDGAAVVAAVVVDKITGLAALLLITGIGLFIDPHGFPDAFRSLFAALMVGLVLVLLFPLVVPNLPNQLNNAFGRFLHAWQTSTQRWQQLLASLLIGIAFQILSVTVIAYIGSGMGIELSFAQWIAVVGLVSLILLLPVTFAGVGLREGGLVILLGFVGIAPVDAVALSFALLGYTLFGAAVGAAADLRARSL